MNIVDGRRVKTNTWKDFIAPDDEHRFFWGTTGPTRFYHSVRMWLPRDARLGRIDYTRGVVYGPDLTPTPLAPPVPERQPIRLPALVA